MTKKTNETITETTNEKRMMNKKTVGIIAGATVTVAAVIISLLCLSACKGENSTATPDEVIGTSVQTVTQVVTDSQGNTHIEEETKVVEVKQTQPSEKSESSVEAKNTAKTEDKSDNNSGNNEQKNAGSNSNNSQSSRTDNNSSNSGSNSNSGTNTNQGGSTSQSQSPQTSKPEPKPEVKPEPTTADPHAGKTWHEAVYEDKYYPAETEQVWVVDEEGYTWERPIYEKHDASICNTCGEEITGNLDHIFEHMAKGENGSYRCETVRTLVGYETVVVPEKGHYETRVTKEAHTERELVREAGWY